MRKPKWISAMVLGVCLATACESGISLPDPATGRPSKDPPHRVAETLTVEGSEVTDSREITGSCVYLYLWSEVGDEADWLPVAQNAMLVTSDFRNEEGQSVFCDLAGHIGSSTYDLPLDKVPDGWYVVCNLSRECSQPFEKA